MSTPFLGEIRLFAGNFVPVNWSSCDGQLLPIADNNELFNLIGTTYGGDGVSTFALPNLAGCVPIHQGSNGTSTYTVAQTGGVTTVQLTQSQTPAHTHPIIADSDPATTSDPTNAYYADTAPKNLYSLPSGAHNPHPSAIRDFNGSMLGSQGGGQPHDNMQPYVAVTYIICVAGTYPST